LDHIESAPQYAIVNLNPDILRVSEGIDFYELHDRLILATAKWLGVSVVSSDGKFAAVEGIEVVWD
jgi:predicted nucleic acid-binding protein